MALVTVVSLVAFVAIGVANHQMLRANIDSALDEALDQGGFGMFVPELGENQGGGRRGNSGSNIPVFCVTVGATGIMFADENQNASMDEDVMAAAVAEVLELGSTEGTLDDYGLFFKVQEDMIGSRIAFAGTSDFNSTMGGITLRLAALWVLLMLVFLFITLFLARYVTRPVEKAWDDQQRFIADASHELKTPLTVILADAAILRDHPNQTVAEQDVWVEGIYSEAERMQRLTEDMLTLAQADAGLELKPVTGRIDFSQEVERICLQFEAVAFERGLSIEDEIDGGVFVVGDIDLLGGAVKTLLENACKYGSDRSAIAVKLSSTKNNAKLTVSNDGPGISPEDLPHVFDRFYRSDKSRAREGSAASFGLGLSIAKSNVEMHGGQISVASADGLTTFTVLLPLAR